MEPTQTYTLYHYYRSSCSYRVRIALNLKNVPCQLHPIDLKVGEQHAAAYHQINPQDIVPALVTPNGILTQSLAIIEYLEECYPTPALLPQDSLLRAKVRAFAQAIACEVHPINNLRVLDYLRHDLHQPEATVQDWYQYWVKLTFATLEQISSNTAGIYTFGDTLSLADVALIPQIYNARRYNVDMALFPTLSKIEKNCLILPAFVQAHPDRC